MIDTKCLQAIRHHLINDERLSKQISGCFTVAPSTQQTPYLLVTLEGGREAPSRASTRNFTSYLKVETISSYTGFHEVYNLMSQLRQSLETSPVLFKLDDMIGKIHVKLLESKAGGHTNSLNRCGTQIFQIFVQCTKPEEGVLECN